VPSVPIGYDGPGCLCACVFFFGGNKPCIRWGGDPSREGAILSLAYCKLSVIVALSGWFLIWLGVIVVRFTLCEAVSAYMRVARKVSD